MVTLKDLLGDRYEEYRDMIMGRRNNRVLCAWTVNRRGTIEKYRIPNDYDREIAIGYKVNGTDIIFAIGMGHAEEEIGSVSSSTVDTDKILTRLSMRYDFDPVEGTVIDKEDGLTVVIGNAEDRELRKIDTRNGTAYGMSIRTAMGWVSLMIFDIMEKTGYMVDDFEEIIRDRHDYVVIGTLRDRQVEDRTYKNMTVYGLYIL